MSLLCSGKTKSGARCMKKGLYTSVFDDNLCFCWAHVKKTDELCTICMNPLFDVNMLCCGHMFHTRCISKWIKYKSTCPICRCIVYDDTVQFKRSSDLASVRMDIRFSS
jgi:hypothetical protein